MSDFDGLCDSDHWSRNGILDYWKGSYTRGSPKGKISVSWNYVSPSQIENYTKCPRSWYFKSILKIPEGQKGHQSLGEAFHLIMEKVPQGHGWPSHEDVNATPEDWEKAEAMAKIALPLLPGADPNNLLDLTPIAGELKREHGLRMATYEGGPTMVGYIDLGVPVGIGWPALLIPPEEAVIVDYKTLSDFRYMKTPQELADNVQMMTYAKWALGEDDLYLPGLRGKNGLEPDHVRLVHLYARTKAPFTRASIRNESAIVSKSEINTRWEKTLDIVREMSQVASCGHPDDVEARGALNGHCEAYGGCAFRDKCGIAKSSGIKGLFQINKKPEPSTPQDISTMAGSTILEKIRAAQEKAKAASVATGTPSATATPAATSSASPGTAADPSTDPQVPNSGNQPAGTDTSAPVATGVASSPTTDIRTAEPTTPSVSPVATGATQGKPISGLMVKIAAQGKGKPTLSGDVAKALGKEMGTPLVTILGEGSLMKTTITTLGDLMKLATGVVPPDAPPREQPVITRPGEVVADPTTEGEDDEDSEEGSVGVSVDGASVAGSTAVPGGVAEAPKKRGRPSNAEIEARKAAEAAALEARIQAEVTRRLALSSVTAVIAESNSDADTKGEIDKLNERINTQTQLIDALRDERDKAREQARSSGSHVQDGLTLYVDCFPTKGDREVVDFFEWIGPICAKVAQDNSVGDWRMISYTAKGLLATALRETIREHGTPKAMTISSFAGGADIALEVLTPIARRVIKKV